MYGSAVSVFYAVLPDSAFTGLACSWPDGGAGGAGWHGGNDMCGHFSVLPGAVFDLFEHRGGVRVRCNLVVFITMIIVSVDFPASTTTRSKK